LRLNRRVSAILPSLVKATKETQSIPPAKALACWPPGPHFCVCVCVCVCVCKTHVHTCTHLCSMDVCWFSKCLKRVLKWLWVDLSRMWKYLNVPGYSLPQMF
jgi:hypothetical protein